MALARSKLKELRALAQRKVREEQQLFLAEGVRLVQDALDSDSQFVGVYYTEALRDTPSGKALLARLKGKTSEVHPTTEREMEAIADTVNAQGILALLRQRRYTPEQIVGGGDAGSLLVAFDEIADPGNLGTMIRTCDWFGVDGILLGKNSVELYNPKVVRSTMGGIFHVPIAADVDLLPVISRARAAGYRVFVTDVHGETHFDHPSYPQKSLLVFGNEAWGVTDQLKQLADVRLSIRRYGAAESLNVSVACGIVLSSMRRLSR